MNAEYEKARRIANNTIAEANRILESGDVKGPHHHAMLTRAVKDASDTIKNFDEMESRRPYSDTKIGYGADNRQSTGANENARSTMDYAMDAIDKILPHISGDYADNAEAKRGVPGSGRSRKRVRVGGYTRRASMDDAYNDAYNDAYDDAYNDAYNAYSDANNNARSTANNEQRMHDAVARATADAAANAAAATARHMANDARSTSVYPSTPVMPHNANNNARNDARNDATSDRSNRLGPVMGE